VSRIRTRNAVCADLGHSDLRRSIPPILVPTKDRCPHLKKPSSSYETDGVVETAAVAMVEVMLAVVQLVTLEQGIRLSKTLTASWFVDRSKIALTPV
ncbi:MAG TPA: hypothetical protein PLQ75_06150, partial [Anaerolineales bacterium]|nr:hypothetical protein [Anaerolineales bacterium]